MFVTFLEGCTLQIRSRMWYRLLFVHAYIYTQTRKSYACKELFALNCFVTYVLFIRASSFQSISCILHNLHPLVFRIWISLIGIVATTYLRVHMPHGWSAGCRVRRFQASSCQNQSHRAQHLTSTIWFRLLLFSECLQWAELAKRILIRH